MYELFEMFDLARSIRDVEVSPTFASRVALSQIWQLAQPRIHPCGYASGAQPPCDEDSTVDFNLKSFVLGITDGRTYCGSFFISRLKCASQADPAYTRSSI